MSPSTSMACPTCGNHTGRLGPLCLHCGTVGTWLPVEYLPVLVVLVLVGGGIWAYPYLRHNYFVFELLHERLGIALLPTSTSDLPAHTSTPTATSTHTPLPPPTATITPRPTSTPTATPPPTATITPRPTSTPTATPPPTVTRMPTPTATRTSPPLINLTALTTITASATSESSIDTCRTPTHFPASNVADGEMDTAWRVEGRGAGEWLRFSFSRPVELAEIRLVPGYAKVDPCTPTLDWCRKNYIPRIVRLRFSDGGDLYMVLRQECAWHNLRFVPRRVTWLEVQVVSTYDPLDSVEIREFTPISEIQLWGRQP